MNDINEKKTTFIDFRGALQLFESLGLPISRTTIYKMIRESRDMPVALAFGRYVFEAEALENWIKKEATRGEA